MSGGNVEPHRRVRSRIRAWQSYETELDGVAFRLRFDFQDEVVDATITQPDGTVHHAKAFCGDSGSGSSRDIPVFLSVSENGSIG